MVDLFNITAPALKGLGLELLDVERAALGLLRITIDKSEGVTIEDCENASRLLSRVFEVEDVDYKRLEVSSPGTDRPLRNWSDFRRFAGERIQVKLHKAVDNQKVFTGILQIENDADIASPADAGFSLTFPVKKNETQTLAFSYSDVEKAKLDPVLDFKGKK